MEPVVLYGATGFTGRLTAHALHARGAPLVLAGRNQEKLKALRAELDGADARVAVARAQDERALRAAFQDAGCVVSTAGPFTRLGWRVVDAAVDAGAHYVDSSGEQAFAHRVRRELDAVARARDVALVPMLAFEYAPGDLAAHLLLDGREADALHVTYHVRHGAASAGTKKSILRVTAHPARQFEHGRLVTESAAARTRTFTVDEATRSAFSFPGGEVLTVPRHEAVGAVYTYMAAHPRTIRRIRLLGPVARTTLREPVLRWLEARVDRHHHDPTPDERRETTFTVLLEADGVDAPNRYTVRGRDPYGLTAELLAEGATRLTRGEGRASGVLAPAEVFDARDFLDTVAKRVGDFRHAPTPA